jgi:cytochrome c
MRSVFSRSVLSLRFLCSIFGAAIAVVSVIPVPQAVAEDAVDPAIAGRKLFNVCRACHTIDADAENGLGPNLFGVVGAKAASNPDFDYSPALKKSGIVWTEENIEKWITSPKALVPGTKMAYVGMQKPEDRAAVLAYLKKMSPKN